MGIKIDKRHKQVLRALIDTFVAPLDDDEALALVQSHDQHTNVQPLTDDRHNNNNNNDDVAADGDSMTPALVVDYSALAAYSGNNGNNDDHMVDVALAWLEHAAPPVLKAAVLTKLHSLHNGWWFRKQRYAFLNLPRAQKEQTIQKWKEAGVGSTSRAVFRVLSAMVLSTVYGTSPQLRQAIGATSSSSSSSLSSKTPPPPSLSSMAGPKGYTRVADPYRMLTLYEAQVLQAITFDVIVVGSGAGAGVIAAQVASVGESVLIIEKGKYYSPDELDPTSEMDVMTKLYDGYGIQYNKTGLVGMMAGSTLGGGTSVEYSVALDPPQSMLDDWAETSGDLFNPAVFKRDLTAVKNRIGVTNKGIKHNKANKILKEGCAKLGVAATDCPNSTRDFLPPTQNRLHRKLQSSISTAPSSSSRQRQQQQHGTPNTWLREAEAYGARFLDQTEVTKVIIKDGKAVGVECLYKNKTSFTYNSKIVVVAAGSMHTPTILKKSGLKNKHIGRHLKLHPTMYVQGYYSDPQDRAVGAVTTATSHVPPAAAAVVASTTTATSSSSVNGSTSSSNLLQTSNSNTSILGLSSNGTNNNGGSNSSNSSSNNKGGGARIQVAHMPPAFSAIVFPWRGALAHKQSMAKHRYAVPLAITAADAGVQDDPTLWRLSKQDETTLVNGLIRACRILAVTGATQIESSQLEMDAFQFENHKGGGLDAVKDPQFNAWLDRIRQTGVPDGIYSMHQMGTCCMSKHPNKGVTKVTGETWEIKHLFVADASLFMSASGVDPLLTVEALAYGVARNIITRLGKKSWS